MRAGLTQTCVVMLLAVACQGDVQAVSLRSEPGVLTEAEVIRLVEEKGFACPALNIKGTFAQAYEPAVLSGVEVVSEHASGLMWQAAESPRGTWREFQAYVEETNQAGHAGFSDWRIPTVEELASLLEWRRSGENYLDDVFTREDLLSTWSADQMSETVGGAWFVNFTEGEASIGNRLAGMGYGRLVRTISSSQ